MKVWICAGASFLYKRTVLLLVVTILFISIIPSHFVTTKIVILCDANKMKFCKFSVFGSFLVVAILINTGNAANNLKEIAHFGNKILYALLVNDDVSGTEANSLCTIKNLTLATLDTQIENDAVGRFLKERASRKEKLVHGWLGGSDEQSEGLWYWLYPYNYIKPYRFENWAAGEPIADDEYNCMYIAPPTKRSGNNGKWKSYYCNERLGMPICMKLTGWRS